MSPIPALVADIISSSCVMLSMPLISSFIIGFMTFTVALSLCVSLILSHNFPVVLPLESSKIILPDLVFLIDNILLSDSSGLTFFRRSVNTSAKLFPSASLG